jgi:phosphoesterase RecJ-like protein
MKRSPEIDQILKLIRENSAFLITSHKDPDGDSIGSQMGLYHALINSGKKATIANQGGMPEKYRFLDPENIIRFGMEPLPFVPEVVFILECPAFDRIGYVAELIPKGAITVNIDHHLGNENYGEINYVDKSSCAVGEIIYAILKIGEINITQQIAEDLYSAIICDTGNFRFASTTARGMEAASELVNLGARPKVLSDNIYSRFSLETTRLLGLTLESLRTIAEGQIGYMQITRDTIRRAAARIEDSEGFVDFSLAIKGVSMGILFKEVDENEIKVSIRSQNGMNAVSFAKMFDGGGHTNAAGFTVQGPLENAVKNVLDKATEYVGRK